MEPLLNTGGSTILYPRARARWRSVQTDMQPLSPTPGVPVLLRLRVCLKARSPTVQAKPMGIHGHGHEALGNEG